VSVPTRLRCGHCRKVKASSQFSRDASRKNGFFPWCMDCQTTHQKSHRFQDETAKPNGNLCPVDDRVVRGHKNRRFCSSRCKDKVARLRRKFNLDIADFRRLVDAADGVCPICLRRPTEWHVDHDHKSGLVMGVVCASCNVGGLAMTFHDPNYIKRLLTFVEDSPASRLGIEARANPKYNQPSSIHDMWYRGKKRRKAERSDA
jgi:hypothetical protein